VQGQSKKSALHWSRNLSLFACLFASACFSSSDSSSAKGMEENLIVQHKSHGPVSTMDVCPSDMTESELREYEKQMTTRFTQKDIKTQSGQQLKFDNIRVVAKVTMRESGSVCETEAAHPKEMYLLQFVGQVNGSAETVVCSTKNADFFEFTGSKCEASVESTFGPLITTSRSKS
jgi:hypothetical protein